MTETDLYRFIELLRQLQGGANQGEMVLAIRTLESRGWTITPPTPAGS